MIGNSNSKYRKYILLVYTLILSLFAFLFIPPPGADLFRIQQMIKSLYNADISVIFEGSVYNKTPLASLLYYIVAQTELYGLLPAIVCFIFYNNIFYILNCSLKKYDNCSNRTIYILVFLMCNGIYVGVISNIRFYLAMSILARTFFDEEILNKSIFKHIPLYICAMFFHSVSIAVIVIRLFCIFLFSKVKHKFRYILVSVVFLLIFITVGNSYWNAMLDKALSYLQADNGYRDIYGYIIYIILVQLMLFILFSFKSIFQEKELSNYIKLILIFLVTAILCVFEYSTFTRFIGFASFLFIPNFIIAMKHSNRQFHNLILIVCLVILCIAVTRGDLSSFKFFVL